MRYDQSIASHASSRITNEIDPAICYTDDSICCFDLCGIITIRQIISQKYPETSQLCRCFGHTYIG